MQHIFSNHDGIKLEFNNITEESWGLRKCVQIK